MNQAVAGRKTEFDAVVVGSGPNGLAAAITLQRAGLSVLLLEREATVGGGMRSAALTLPGYLHDVCSAVHPMALASPFFKSLPLDQHGLEFIVPPVQAAHPLNDGSAAVLLRSLEQTAGALGADKQAYLELFEPFIESWPKIVANLLGPLSLPDHPIDLARFGLKAFQPATTLAERFTTPGGRGLFAGMAAHSMRELSAPVTSAIGLVLSVAGHMGGWPIPKGGSQNIANALAAHFVSLGGEIETGVSVNSLAQLPSTSALLLDVSPKQLLQIAGEKLSPAYRWQLERYSYGMGVFKVDWALDGPAEFTAPQCNEAGTVHIGGTLEEIAASEDAVSHGQHPAKPFVLFTQPSRFDPSRAPEGKHVAWAYCHVPNGSQVDMTERIEAQVERFAPGFRDRILARHTMNTTALESYNPNYIGGDINGGAVNLGQLFTRPVVSRSPYRTSAGGLYLCSASTPPGGGVHGMCGYHAAQQALHDVFRQ